MRRTAPSRSRSTNCGSRKSGKARRCCCARPAGKRRSRRAFQPALARRSVVQERRSLRDIALASLTISFLTIFPPLMVMTMVNKVAAVPQRLHAGAAVGDDGDRRRL